MRNALGLLVASVVLAVVITAVWFFTSSPRADHAAPSTVAALQAEPPPVAAAKPAPTRDDVEITAALSTAPKAPIAPQTKAVCANPDALGVARVVEIDTT